VHSTFVPDEVLTHTRPIVIDPANPHSEPQSRYDLFRQQHEPGLYCAVPKGQPAPAFLQSDQWKAAGEMDAAGPAPLGFDREAARTGVRLNGFYLFVAFSPVPGLWSDSADRPPRRLFLDGSAQSARMAY